MMKKGAWQRGWGVAPVAALAMLAAVWPSPLVAAGPDVTPSPTRPASAPDEVATSDFNGVWRIVGYSEVIRPEDSHPEYTEEGLRRIRNFKEHYDEAKDTPGKFCYHVGMPWTMVTRARDYPTEVYQTGERVVLFHEGMDMYRHIHLDTQSFPPNYVASAQGFSIAHWDKGDLVIETRGLTATNEVSPQHRSDQARITERWHLFKQAGQNDRWEITFIFEDPVILTTPAHGRQLMERAEPGTVVGGYNCPQSLWDDYVASIKEQREGHASATARKSGAKRR